MSNQIKSSSPVKANNSQSNKVSKASFIDKEGKVVVLPVVRIYWDDIRIAKNPQLSKVVKDMPIASYPEYLKEVFTSVDGKPLGTRYYRLFIRPMMDMLDSKGNPILTADGTVRRNHASYYEEVKLDYTRISREQLCEVSNEERKMLNEHFAKTVNVNLDALEQVNTDESAPGYDITAGLDDDDIAPKYGEIPKVKF